LQQTVDAIPRPPLTTLKPESQMKIPNRIHDSRSHGFTLIELLVVISIIAILAGFALPVFTNVQKKGRITNTLNNAKQISYALKLFAGDNDGSFPLYTNPDDTTTQLANSNAAMQLLMPKYTPNKQIFINKASAWCKQPGGGTATQQNQYQVMQGECDWSYVRGLSETADPRSPLLATAFKPGTIQYAKNTSEKGGVWAGTDAVVVLVDFSAKQLTMPADIRDMGEVTEIKRPDQPSVNMFQFDSTWVGNEAVVVHPLGG
jgi:prepilin-type N-terminal cleavage/methylation domain-containing protein